MKKLSIAAGLAAVAVAVPVSHRLEPPRGAEHGGRPDGRRHRRLRVHGATTRTDSLTVVANWIPFEDPAGGPNFYQFDPRARYYVNVDNTGDGAYDVRYRFEFKTKIRNKRVVRGRAAAGHGR